MASPANPADMRAYILERLVGDIGEPDHVIEAARALAERAIPAVLQGFADCLAAPVGVELRNVELARFADARPEDATGHAMTIAASASSPDALILLLDPGAIAVAVSTLFGGDPDQPVAPIERELSPTEIEVATMLFGEFAKAINGSGARAFDIRFPLAPSITGVDLRKQIVRDGPAVRIVFAVFTPAGAGKLTVLMPQRVLLKHRGNGGSAEAAPNADWRAKFNEEVMRSSISLEATMPLSRLTLGEIAGFEEGQVIELDAGAQAQARLSARNKTLYVCEFGKLGQNYTVRIRHPFDAGQEFMDGLVPG